MSGGEGSPQEGEHSGRRRSDAAPRASGPAGSGRLSAALLVVVVLVTGGGLYLAGRAAAPLQPQRRTEAIVLPAQRQLVCPLSDTTSTSYVGLLPGIPGGGTVSFDGTPVDLAAGSIVEAGQPGRDPLTITTTGAATRGIFATRVQDTGGLTRCGSPRASWWFSGAGAGVAHRSTLELSNPSSGPAVVDVSVFGPDGPVTGAGLRGISVRAGARTVLNLAKVAPADGNLAVHVQVSRGLVVAAVQDHTVDFLDPKASTVSEWIPDQAQPERRVVLSGIPPPSAQVPPAPGAAQLPAGLSDGAALVIANPGQNAVVAKVRISGKDGAVAPNGLGPTTVPPQSAVSVPFAKLVDQPASSVIVDADGPVTAGYVVPGVGDLVHAVPGVHWHGPAAAALPTTAGTSSTLMLTADGSAGKASVTQLGPRGKQLAQSTVRVHARSTVTTALVPGAASIVVTSSGQLTGSVLVTRGTTYSVLPLTPVLAGLRVPVVRAADVD